MNRTPRYLNCERMKFRVYNMIKFELGTILVFFFFPVKYPRNWYITGLEMRKSIRVEALLFIPYLSELGARLNICYNIKKRIGKNRSTLYFLQNKN